MSLVMSFGGVDPSGQFQEGFQEGLGEVSLVMSFGGVDPSVPGRVGVKCL